MKIKIDRNPASEFQHPIHTIDLKHCHYPYAIRNALEKAMELDGYAKDVIDEVFGRMPTTMNAEPAAPVGGSPSMDTHTYCFDCKFKIGDQVWVVLNGQATQQKVASITHIFDSLFTDTSLILKDSAMGCSVNYVYSTKEECEAALKKEVNNG